MNPGASLQSYRQISLETAPPGELVRMLYDGAIRFLGLARIGFESEDPLERNLAVHNNVTKAQDILNELVVTLDMDLGGKLAETLRDLYLYMGDRLQESNINKAPAGIDEVTERLTEIRDAWCQMLANQANGQHDSISGFVEAVG
ncbi:MAG: flagellar export chaperone FliS [Verrucomicrobia bacterium]|jgi:flagellar secretion chaperone FliS|nr:flagellar export chaperone FliS [Verrucomicrobiota bacterium]MDA7510503.1 flagellar export chaperone FliS [Verrucomicrobiota bacterium]